MSIRQRSKGITLIGFVVLLLVVGFFAYLAMRLIPMYVEYMGVVKAMEQLKSEGGAGNKSPYQIRRDLSFKFSLQYVESGAIPDDAIMVTRKAGATTLRIRYERRVPFIHNIELVGTFDKSIDLSGFSDG